MPLEVRVETVWVVGQAKKLEAFGCAIKTKLRKSIVNFVP